MELLGALEAEKSTKQKCKQYFGTPSSTEYPISVLTLTKLKAKLALFQPYPAIPPNLDTVKCNKQPENKVISHYYLSSH